jgi:5-methyltetrahydrofolate corrinoid/iron sulfur protein methyltransferase
MVLIGESIHIISKDVNDAVKERNPKVIQDLAKAQTDAGADYIDPVAGQYDSRSHRFTHICGHFESCSYGSRPQSL